MPYLKAAYLHGARREPLRPARKDAHFINMGCSAGAGRSDAGVIMPIYEYQCPKCQRVFEEWVKASEAHGQEPCPHCGTPSSRIISQTSFVLKGGGWYVSDYGYRKGISEDGAPASSAPAGEDKTGAAEAPKAAPAPAEQTAAKAAPPSRAARAKSAPAAS